MLAQSRGAPGAFRCEHQSHCLQQDQCEHGPEEDDLPHREGAAQRPDDHILAGEYPDPDGDEASRKPRARGDPARTLDSSAYRHGVERSRDGLAGAGREHALFAAWVAPGPGVGHGLVPVYAAPMPGLVYSGLQREARRPTGRRGIALMYTLYWSAECGSFAPNAALAEAGVEFDLIEVDLAAGAHHAPEFLAINPRAQVPVFEVARWHRNDRIGCNDDSHCGLSSGLSPAAASGAPRPRKGLSLVVLWNREHLRIRLSNQRPSTLLRPRARLRRPSGASQARSRPLLGHGSRRCSLNRLSCSEPRSPPSTSSCS